MKIWFASGNHHKKAELAAILKDQGLSCNVLIPQDVGLDFDPEETGKTFHDNSLLKARELYVLLDDTQNAGHWQPGDLIIADDSGICVDALDGRPGIHSARYAGTATGYAGQHTDGKKITASERNALLLAELGDNPQRSARFVCAMTLLFNPDRFYIVQETCEGVLVKSPDEARGTNGFGYDPILFIPELNSTMAELSDEVKNRISHRAKAGKVIAGLLRDRGSLLADHREASGIRDQG